MDDPSRRQLPNLFSHPGTLIFRFFFKILFIYLRDSVSKRAGEGEGEADSPLSREPDMGLNPRTLGS